MPPVQREPRDSPACARRVGGTGLRQGCGYPRLVRHRAGRTERAHGVHRPRRQPGIRDIGTRIGLQHARTEPRRSRGAESAARSGGARARTSPLMDDVPLGWQRAVAAAWPAPDIADLNYERASLFRSFREHDISPARADYGVAAIPADIRAADLLLVPEDTCLLQVKAVTSDQHGRPIEISEGMFLGDRYRFSASVSDESRPQP